MNNLVKEIVIKHYVTKITDIFEELKNSNASVISFDIFDTLIKRNVMNPEDIFEILENKFNKKFNKHILIKNERMNAEIEANSKSKSEDVTLHQIYMNFKNIDDDEREWLENTEITLERKFCQQNIDVYPLYKWCLEHHKRILITTDMYLPRDVIEEILVDNGYNNWDNLYLSCERGFRKSSGNLFKLILEQENIKVNDIIHIGDALKGDFLIPKKMGIKCYLIKRSIKNFEFCNNKILKNSIDYNFLESFISNNISRNYSYYERIGYETVGPILYGYCKWLIKQINNNGINKVFFLAREGFLLDKAFSIFNPVGIKHCVIRVSRKATATPLLYKANSVSDIYSKITVKRADFTISNLLDACGLNSSQKSKAISELKINANEVIEKVGVDERNEIYSKLKPYIDKESKYQDKCIHGYMQPFDFKGRIAVADVGWHGTIQNALQEIFPENEIWGYYIGRKEKQTKQTSKSEAFLFDDPVKNHQISKEIMSAVDLFELFFLSTDGSAMRYEHSQNGEYICIQGKPEQREENVQQIISIQNAALQFIKDLEKYSLPIDITLSEEICEASYSKFINPPSLRTVKSFTNFSFLNVDTQSLVATHNLVYYIFHPKKFISEFLNNGSKAIFLRSVFKLPLAYADIIDYMRKFDKS